MKKSLTHLLAIITIVTAGALTSNAQELGIRFGGTNSNGGVAIDGVFEAGRFSRIHEIGRAHV